MKVAYVQHPHEFKTNSASFFREYIKQQVELVHRIDRDKINRVDFSGYDLVICFQADNALSKIAKLNLPILAVCMLDESLHLTSNFFKSLRNVCFLSFSSTLHDFLTLSGCKSTHIQYWPKLETNFDFQRNHVFFWERTPEHFSIGDLLNAFDYRERILLRQEWDPGQFSIKRSIGKDSFFSEMQDGWLSHEDYLVRVRESKVFVAPRKWEGIGLSFLEALSFGIPVIGLNFPTLNEYISHMKTGFLLNNKFEKIPNLQWTEMRANVEEAVIRGRRIFEETFYKSMNQLLELGNYKDNESQSVLPGRITLRQFIYLTSGR